MTEPMRHRIAEQVGTQFLEADVETGFALVDEAKSYVASGQLGASSQVLQEAAKILADIEYRIGRLGEVGSRPFQLLIAELRNELEAVERSR